MKKKTNKQTKQNKTKNPKREMLNFAQPTDKRIAFPSVAYTWVRLHVGYPFGRFQESTFFDTFTPKSDQYQISLWPAPEM